MEDPLSQMQNISRTVNYYRSHADTQRQKKKFVGATQRDVDLLFSQFLANNPGFCPGKCVECCAVPQQVGNSCAPHSVINAFRALSIEIPSNIDLTCIDQGSAFLESFVGGVDSIFVLETGYALSDHHLSRGLGLEKALEQFRKNIDIACIVNTAQYQQLNLPNALGHWIVISLHHRGGDVVACIRDSQNAPATSLYLEWAQKLRRIFQPRQMHSV